MDAGRALGNNRAVTTIRNVPVTDLGAHESGPRNRRHGGKLGNGRLDRAARVAGLDLLERHGSRRTRSFCPGSGRA
jgi:hypothetical protein